MAGTGTRARGRVASAELAAHDAALIDAAAGLFLKFGFGGTSIDMIAKAAHVSPKTIYQRHGGKSGLFAMVMRRQSDRALAPFRELAVSDEPIEGALLQFGARLLELVLSERAIALQRAVIAEATRFPEFARIYYAQGPERGLDLLAGYLRRGVERGEYFIADPDRAAEAFVALVNGEPVRRAILNIDDAAPVQDTGAHLASAVLLFLKGALSEVPDGGVVRSSPS